MKLRDIVRDVLVKILSNILWILLTACWMLLLTNVSAAYQYLVDLNISRAIVLPGMAALGLAGVFVSARLIAKGGRNKYRPVFPRIEFDYSFLEFTFELLFMDRNTVELRSFCKMKALKEIKECVRHYHWTGTSSEPPEFMDNPHQHRLVEQSMMEPGMHYKVVFNSPLYANDETDFSVRIRCLDEGCRMHPHHCFRVLKPTEKLTLRLVFCDDLINTVNRGVYADDSAEIPLEKIVPVPVRQEGGLRIYEWVINKPSLLSYYRLDWTFRDS